MRLGLPLDNSIQAKVVCARSRVTPSRGRLSWKRRVMRRRRCQLQLVVFVAGGQVVNFVAYHGHGAVQAPVFGQVQAQALGMAPGTTFEPGDVGGVVGVAEAVDVFAADAQVDDEGCCQVPAHARS